jgi:hypothetical protein
MLVNTKAMVKNTMLLFNMADVDSAKIPQALAKINNRSLLLIFVASFLIAYAEQKKFIIEISVIAV